MNIFAVLCGIGLVLLGNMLGTPELSGFGGTFFVLFFFGKLLEVVPSNKMAYAWTFLVIGVSTVVVNMFLMENLEQFGIDKYFHLFPISM